MHADINMYIIIIYEIPEKANCLLSFDKMQTA
jgi:hypothetical protein